MFTGKGPKKKSLKISGQFWKFGRRFLPSDEFFYLSYLINTFLAFYFPGCPSLLLLMVLLFFVVISSSRDDLNFPTCACPVSFPLLFLVMPSANVLRPPLCSREVSGEMSAELIWPLSTKYQLLCITVYSKHT